MNKNIVIVGMLCITVLEAVALFKSINGVLLTAVIGVLAAAIGVTIPRPKEFR